jgi:hypothetical protein
MKTNKQNRKDRIRAEWMSQFEDAVTKGAPELTGKVDWDSATYFFLSGKSASESAAQHLVNYHLRLLGDKSV